MEEIWKSISGYEGYYEVSNLGKVKSLDRYVKNKNRIIHILGKLLTPHHSEYGLKVTLQKGNKEQHIFVHRLVALAFIDNSNNYKYIIHKDGDKTNNRSENLEWTSYKYKNVDGKIIRGIHNGHTYEECYIIAKKYNTRSEFQKKDKGYYKSALKEGWLGDYDWFLSNYEARSNTQKGKQKNGQKIKSIMKH